MSSLDTHLHLLTQVAKNNNNKWHYLRMRTSSHLTEALFSDWSNTIFIITLGHLQCLAIFTYHTPMCNDQILTLVPITVSLKFTLPSSLLNPPLLSLKEGFIQRWVYYISKRIIIFSDLYNRKNHKENNT